jgi:CspA family cold shock protein
MHQGIIKKWNRERGFGFVRPDAGIEDVFVHVKQIAVPVDELSVGQRISFDIGTDPRSGKTRAVDVRLID